MRLFNLKVCLLAFVLSANCVMMPSAAIAQDGAFSRFFGQKSQKFLPVNQAFGVAVHMEDDEVVATFQIAPGHYLYRDKIGIKLPDGVSMGEWRFDKTVSMIDDPDFGRVAVFEEDVVARTKLNAAKEVNKTLFLHWQGCAKAGLCYPPEKTQFQVVLNANKNLTTQTPKTTQNDKLAVQTAPNIVTPNAVDKPNGSQYDGKDSIKTNKTPTKTIVKDQSPVQNSQDSNQIAQNTLQGNTQNNDQLNNQSIVPKYNLNHTLTPNDPFGISDNPILAIGLLFLAGLLLAFTPCVYPMIPIVANIVARQKTVNAQKALMLSAAYGLGVACAYGLLGALIAWLGRTVNILGYLQNQTVLIAFAVLFAVLALHMFDRIKIGLPTFIRNSLQSKSAVADGKLGSVSGSFLAGGLSALVVSPCVSAPMAGALAAVSVSGSIGFGFLALFMLGLGLSVPLVLMATVQGKFMPKAGAWMAYVKEFCGILLFAVSLALIERVLISSLMLVMWAVWFVFVSVWLWQIKKIIAQALSLTTLMWALCLMVGVSMGSKDAWQPLGVKSDTTYQFVYPDRHITTLAELDAILSSHDKVLVDLTADWCVECRIMERELFTHRPSELNDVQVVKFDITQTTENSRAMLDRYRLSGPPALIFYQKGRLHNMMLGQTQYGDFKTALANF